MARIEHRRLVRRGPDAATKRDTPDPTVLAVPDGDDDDEPAAPDAALDRLSWLGWVSAGVALGWLLIQLRPLLDGGAFSEARRLDDLRFVLRAVSGAAARALPAALELGVGQASRRVPWLYRGAVLLAVAEVATVLLDQAHDRFLADVHVSDPTKPIVLAYAIASLAPAIATIGGLWAASDGLWDIGARPARVVLRLVGGAAVLVTLLTYVPYLNQVFSPDAIVVSLLNLVRLAVSLALIGITAVVATHLLAGAIARMTPRL